MPAEERSQQEHTSETFDYFAFQRNEDYVVALQKSMKNSLHKSFVPSIINLNDSIEIVNNTTSEDNSLLKVKSFENSTEDMFAYYYDDENVSAQPNTECISITEYSTTFENRKEVSDCHGPFGPLSKIIEMEPGKMKFDSLTYCLLFHLNKIPDTKLMI